MDRTTRPILHCCWFFLALSLTAGSTALGLSARDGRVAMAVAQVPGIRIAAHRPPVAPIETAVLDGVPEAVEGPPGEIPFLDDTFCTLEKDFFDDSADGRLDEFSLLDAALVASGVRRTEDLRRYERQLARLVDELQALEREETTPRDRAEIVFDFLHQHVLSGGYGLQCTDLRLAFDQGRYNCVSASVMYNCLAAGCGLEVCGLEMPNHAMSRVVLDGQPLDVETTCPTWFRLLQDPRRQAEMIERRAVGISAEMRAKAREVSPIQMAAMIYYNRGVDLLAAQHYREAAVVNAKALRLDDTSSTARGNLLATINNWAIALGTARRFAEAVALLETGLNYDPQYETFLVNYVHVHYQWTEALCTQRQYEQAVELLTRAGDLRPDRAYFRQARSDVYRRWAEDVRASGQHARAAELLQLSSRS